MFICTILAGTTYTKLALYLWVNINAFLAICTSWEILAILCRMNKRTIFCTHIAVWKMFTFNEFLFLFTLKPNFLLEIDNFFLLRLFNHFLPTWFLKPFHSIHSLRAPNLILGNLHLVHCGIFLRFKLLLKLTWRFLKLLGFDNTLFLNDLLPFVILLIFFVDNGL